MQNMRTIFIELLVLIPTLAFAHHGKEFLLTASSRTPHQGQWFGILSSDYEKNSHHLNLEPGILYGITHSWSSELHLHLGELTDHPTLESLGFEQRVALWHEDDEENSFWFPFEVGALVEFEKSLVLNTEDKIEFRGLLFRSTEMLDLALNVIVIQPIEQVQTTLAYAIGAKHTVGSKVSIGLEMTGNLRNLTQSSLTPGISLHITNELDARMGTSFDFGPGPQLLLVRMSLLMEL